MPRCHSGPSCSHAVHVPAGHGNRPATAASAGDGGGWPAETGGMPTVAKGWDGAEAVEHPMSRQAVGSGHHLGSSRV